LGNTKQVENVAFSKKEKLSRWKFQDVSGLKLPR
jgi:hypothetical protein